MDRPTVQVDADRVVVGLGRFRLSLLQNRELMQEIANSQLQSIYQTFREEGSPSGSWLPLSPNTIRRDPNLYGAGHKLLVKSGYLRNSINAKVRPGMAIIAAPARYAAVHQFGSRDRSAAIGPQSEAESKAVVNVKAHSYARLSAELGSGLLRGRKRRIQGPRNMKNVIVGSHVRHQNIPARPFLVFRAGDPARIRGIVQRYISNARSDAGLRGGK